MKHAFSAGVLVVLLAGCGSDQADPVVTAEAGEWLPGGETTNTLMLGVNAFLRPSENISIENEMKFFTGNSFFNQPWVTAPASTQTRDGLGPLFNSRSCSGCHFKDGRGAPTNDEGEFESLLMRISVGEDDHGNPTPHPVYGLQLQPHGIQDVPGEARPRVEYTTVNGSYDDGTAFTLQSPEYTIPAWGYGEPGEIKTSVRLAPQMIGLGLLEAIPEARLDELEDPDDLDGDGISGRVARVWNGETMVVGRFGWKAEEPTVESQSAGAFLGDMGITSPLHVSQNCASLQEECKSAITGGDPEVEPHLLERVVVYSSLLAPPVRRGWDTPQILRGKALFADTGCASCHTPRHETSSEAAFAEVAGQTIWPYTDLLLHDMGPELADNRPSGGADGQEWRTPPLWGIGLLQAVNGHQRLLHDGRADGVAEAILWHGGESEASRDAFVALSKDEREDLIRFVESL